MTRMEQQCRSVVFVWALFFLIFLDYYTVCAKELIVLVQPVTSTAGEPLSFQPVVALTDDDGNILTNVNTGSVKAVIGVNPSRFGVVQPTTNSFDFINGIARCADLYINLVGSGYTLQLISMLHGVRAETSAFDVVVGPKYKLAIVSDVSTAYGGEPFLPQPAVAVVDKGGNLISDLNTGTVKLEIIENPANGRLLPGSSLNVSIGGGYAKFQGIYIDVAGTPYSLRYWTDLKLDGGNYIDTNPFTVAAGGCNAMVLLNTMSEATGGRAFPVQPVLKLIDSGGNLLLEDSSSYVRVLISSNPSDGTLTPSSSLRTPVSNGMAIFRNLRIDKAGNDYSLLFILYKKVPGKTEWTETEIKLVSESFNVIIGPPTTLFFRQSLSDGVLDGQPIGQQPILNVLDAGGNIVNTIKTGNVVASMIPSPGTLSSIVVDTSSAPQTQVIDVTALTASLPSPYGVGMLVRIQVRFTDEVIATGLPRLELNTGSGTTRMAECSTVNVWGTKLVFDYIVAAGDTSSDLNYQSTTSLTLNSGSIKNRNGVTPSLTLPDTNTLSSLAGTSAVVIDTTSPTIESVSSSAPGNGEYGSGEEIYIHVLFSASVTVFGAPKLKVDLDTIEGGAPVRYATFSSGNNTDTLVFIYTVQNGDAAGALDVTTDIILGTNINIRRTSTSPTTDATLTMVTAPNNLATLNRIVIDTTNPQVDETIGVTSTTSNGVYAPGDVIQVVVTFTKPVMVEGFPRIYLETGVTDRSAGYISGSGTKSLTFAYTVEAFDSHSTTGNLYLNYRDDNCIDLNGGSIRRLIKKGTLSADADLSLQTVSNSNRSLKKNSQIELDGIPPSIQSLQIISPTGGTTLFLREKAIISVSFSKRIHVDISKGKPSLQLAFRANNRQAIYISGSGTSALEFEYEVKLGDSSVAIDGVLDYISKDALLLNGARIRRFSTSPTLDAILTLPLPSASLANPPVLIDPGIGTITKILSVTADLPSGEYGSNQIVTITVKFTDEVIVDGLPYLLLNTNAKVPYVSGTATDALIFMYVVEDEDTTTSLDVLNEFSFQCYVPSCIGIVNYNNENVDLSLTNLHLFPSNIQIDTQAPIVLSVYSITSTSIFNENSFVVGDEIEIIVQMSLDVFIDPPPSANPEKAPILVLNTNLDGREVLCQGYGTTDDGLLDRSKLLFKYIVQKGDQAIDLTYMDINSLNLNNAQSTIKRFSTTPKTDAILTLPTPVPLGQKNFQILNVDSTKIPRVLSVTSTNLNGIYHAGDEIIIVVTFSQHVIVKGTPILWLDLGKNDRQALYFSGSGSMELFFSYLVMEDDFNLNLEYLDHHSLEAPQGSTGGQGDINAILHKSTYPTTLANLDLPFPRTEKSLSFGKNIFINGRKPTILSTQFLNLDGKYQKNDQIKIQVVFSSCVMVDLTNGRPSIKLQMGSSTNTAATAAGSNSLIRDAFYVGGSLSTKLFFEYTILTGDFSNDLDYAMVNALVLNEGRILTCTSTGKPPSQAVDLHLNPPGGKLLGTTTKPITFGRISFTDLKVDRLGFGYRIFFQTSINQLVLESISNFDMLYSSAFELRSNPFAKNDRLGYSVDVYQNTLILGGNGAKKEISAIQIVTALGDASNYLNEIQVLQSFATQRSAIQELTSKAAPGETIGGFFYLTLTSTIQLTTRKIYYNFDETQLRVALELDLGFGLNSIRISRTPNDFCGCQNGFIWLITFLNVQGPLSALKATSFLTGNSASVGDEKGENTAKILVESTAIDGFFTLSIGNLLVSRNIKYDVDETELFTILSQDLGLPVFRVSRSVPTLMREYTWSITYTASDTLYDVPDLIPQFAGLKGYQAKIRTRTEINGEGRLAGTFRLRFRDEIFHDETQDISVTATDNEMKMALENLEGINNVMVTRSTSMNIYGGYSWTITFVQVNTKNEYGSIVDHSGNLPPIKAITEVNLQKTLKGNNARIEVKYGGYSLPPIVYNTHFGLPGENAGMVAVFIRAENDWKEQPTGILVGSDTRNGDLFGSSVSIYENFVLVGAPAAAIYGEFEKQSLYCDADAGFFRIIFNGKKSFTIPFNADKEKVQIAIVQVMSVPYSDVEVSTFNKLCEGQEIIITLRTSDHADRFGNVPELSIDPTNLLKNGLPAIANIREYSTGTYRRDGIAAKGLQSGAAYIFVRNAQSIWSQTTKLYPVTNLESIKEYGLSVAINNQFAIVGAPGAFQNEGRVFVYRYNFGTTTWSLFQILTAAPFNIFEGDRFGESVAIADTTIVVGAPGHSVDTGAVFVFDLSSDGNFKNKQQLQPSEFTGGDRFGTSVDIDMTTFTLVAGAEKAKIKGIDAGAAAVYVKRSAIDTFFTMQKLLFGSDTREHDRFGKTVAVSKDTIVIGAHEEFSGIYTIRKPVQAITLSSISILGGISGNEPVGTFQLTLEEVNSTTSTDLIRKTTRPIAYNIDKESLEVILEEDLPIGNVRVERDGPSATRGYTWYITFLSCTRDLSLLAIDYSDFVVEDALVTSRWITRMAPSLRGNAYLYTRNGNTGEWTEQATLFPREKQLFSWFGTAVSISGRTAIVGAPNLDTFESGTNSGGGFVFDLGFLSLGFSAKTYEVLEGNSLQLRVQRCQVNSGYCAMDVTASPSLFINYDTGDAYSDRFSSNYVHMDRKIGPYKKLSLLEAVPFSTKAFFASDVIGQEPFPFVSRGRWLMPQHVGTANGRDQFYGSIERRSQWIDACFDYSGESDYSTSTGELFFDTSDLTKTFTVDTTSDYVVEIPDETITVRLSLPGVWPSYGGNLWSTITIKDDGDGGSGTRSYLELLRASTPQSGSKFSSSIDIYDPSNGANAVAIIGAPNEKQTIGNSILTCGAAYFFVRRSGIWELLAKQTPPLADCKEGLKFGASVSIDGYLGTQRAIVGAPGGPAAYVYQRIGDLWIQENKFMETDATQVTHSYGGERAVAIHGDIAVVGAAGLECIFVYHRVLAGWQFIVRLHASDRVVHQILEKSFEQTYRFGSSLALSYRTIVVGAPYGDAGAFTPQQYHSDSFDKKFFGPGAAYIYHIQAQEQTISLQTDNPLTGGSFTLSVTQRGVAATSRKLSYAATAAQMKSAIEELSTIRLVEATRIGTIEKGFVWTVTFIGEILPVPLLQPAWKDFGCIDCDAFTSSFSEDPANQILVTQITPIGTWGEHARITSPDANPGDRFGHSVDISGDQVIVGAYTSAALSTTTWNFETGDLTGWLTTGDAFDSQPTYGDNSYARINVYSFRPHTYEAAGQRSQYEGRYWVGTFESRPGATRKSVIASCSFANDLCRAPNYNLPGTNPAGSYQGDGPQGTMTSQAFTILGDWVSFKLGGGCDINVIYVELLVDGMSVRKATGRCEEQMKRIQWDIGEYLNQTAQIRVVDASSSDFWGHINFDDVQFGWDVSQTTTPRAGVAYTFRRKSPGTLEPCLEINRELCDWEFQARLIASDKRTDDRFGFDVATDDGTGIAIIGAPGQSGVDSNNTLINKKNITLTRTGAMEQIGSVYLFKRQEEKRDGKGKLVTPPRWNPKETVKLQYPNKKSFSQFGHAIALDKFTFLTGAPWLSTSEMNFQVGQAFAYDLSFQYIKFTSSIFFCIEGNPNGKVSLSLSRDGNLDMPVTIGFATEDLNARAIDPVKYTDCMKIAINKRLDCFDFQQTSGEITFAPGETSKQIMIPIVDDFCYEKREEWFLVRLNIPGGEPLIGENYIARVRIDDDDFAYEEC